MYSRTLLNLALLVIVIVLGLTIYFRPGLETEPIPQALTAFDQAEITRIKIARENQPEIRLYKDDLGWQLDGTPVLPAEDFHVRGLLRLAGQTGQRSYPVDELALEQIGLAAAKTSIYFNDLRIDIGNTEGLEQLRYVRVNDFVHLIQDTSLHLLQAERESLISRALLPTDADIESLHLPDLQLNRSATASWELQPNDTAAAADAIQQLITTWQRASALQVRSYEEAASLANIHITLAPDGNSIEWKIIAYTPMLILARPDLGIQYEFTAEMAESLLSLPVEDPGPASETPHDPNYRKSN